MLQICWVPPATATAKPVVKKCIELNKYKENTEYIELEDHDTFPIAPLTGKHVADITVISSTCDNTPEVTIANSILCPPPPRPKQQYTKHSRCHCNLLGTETDDFFRVTECDGLP